MAITTVDQAIAGMRPPVDIAKAVTGTLVAGRPHTLLFLAGNPGAAASFSNAIGVAGQQMTTLSGQIPFTNPVSGSTYLARVQGQATQAGTLMVCDLLWVNTGLSTITTTEQVFTNAVGLPARDDNAATLGAGCQAAVLVTNATGAGVPTLTLKYTNSSGTPGQTGVNSIATVATSIAGTIYPIGFAAGDVGIMMPSSLTLNATWTSGTISVIVYRVLARLELTAPNIPNAIDCLTGGFPLLHNNSVPFLVFVPNTTTTSNICGHVIFTQG